MKREYKGEWFLPNNQEIKLPGILEVNPSDSSILLRIYSQIDFDGNVIPSQRENGFQYRGIILGNVNQLYSEITLYPNIEKGSPVFENRINKELFESRYEPRVAFIGKHFFSKDEICFKSFSFRYTYLGDWIDAIRPSFFNVDWVKNDFILSYRNIPDLELQIFPNCKLRIKRDCSIHGESKSEKTMLLKHFADFEFDAPKPFQEFYNLSEKLQTFLFFAIGSPVELIENYPGSDSDNPIEIINAFVSEQNAGKWLHPNQMPLSPRYFSDEELKKYLYNWFQFYDNFQAVFDTFTQAVKPFWRGGSLTTTNLEFSNGILNIAQAIENFFKKDKEIDYKKIKDEFTTKRNLIFGKIKKHAVEIGLTEDNIEFVNKNLKIGNKENYPFINIISYFLENFKIALLGFLDDDEHVVFAKNFKDCRDTLTHINHTNASDVSNTFDLSYLFYYSQIIFYVITLNKIGLDQNQINSTLVRSREFGRYFKHNLNQKSE